MLVLTAATLLLLIALLFFGLNYVRMLGSNAEQKTAIEAAAIAAATDVSRIVINTPQFGYVSLSDAAPIGSTTQAGDSFYLPVRSINTIIGTARVDYIIGDKLGDPTIMAFAKQDLDNAQLVIPQLTTALNQALQPGGSGQDMNGATVTPYTDAVTAYQQNEIRLTGSSKYVQGSLKLALGGLDSPTVTNIPVPNSSTLAQLPTTQAQNGQYKSYTNVAYKNVNFVFGGIGASTILVDPNHFKTTVPGIAYQIPTVVQAQADQVIRTSQTQSGPDAASTIHAIACAQPSSVFDPKPAPGALTVSFPDGNVPELKSMQDIFNYQWANSPSTLLTPNGGDYYNGPGCTATMQSMGWPVPPQTNPANQPVGIVWRGAFFDWIRRGGTKVNVEGVLGIMAQPFVQNNTNIDWKSQIIATGPIVDVTQKFNGPQIPVGTINIWKFDQTGNTVPTNKVITPYPYAVSSNNQMYGELLNAIQKSSVAQLDYNNVMIPILKGEMNPWAQQGSTTQSIKGHITFSTKFDCYIRDEVRQPGTILGGIHAGEPLNDATVAMLRKNALLKDYGQGGSGAGCGGCGGWCGFCGHCGYNPHPGCGGCGWNGCNPCTPCAPTCTSGPTGTRGGGAIPLIGSQSDFDEIMQPAASYDTYPNSSGGDHIRTTYTTNGSAVDIRFRRQIVISGEIKTSKGYYTANDIGYIAQKY